MRRLWPASVALVLVALGGCVHREIEIMTRPPGARVEFDGQVLERTSPVRFPFYWYGYHEIIVEKPSESTEPGKPARPGYIRKRLIVHVEPPLYEQFPLDLFTELLWPGRIYDIRSYPIALDKELPLDDVPDDEKAAMKTGLFERGDQFRRMAREELGLPPPAVKKEEAPRKEEPAKKEAAPEAPPPEKK